MLDPCHPVKVLEGLNRLRLNCSLCDVILSCGGQEFPCHRVLLASFSTYFEAMFRSVPMECTQEKLQIWYIEPEVLDTLLNYAYTSTVSISLKNVQALLAASTLLDVTGVQEACLDYMERHVEKAGLAKGHMDGMSEMFVDPNHSKKVLLGLRRQWLKGALCDVILCCEGQWFPCHRSVLASLSTYFEAMFTSGMMESTQHKVTISGVKPKMLGLLVNYAYISKVSISKANVQALLAASNFLDVTAVREACGDYLKRHIDIHNCVGIHCLAETHSSAVLEQHSMDYILEHFSDIYRQEEFLSLSVERLTAILSSDHLNGQEDMVFEASMAWLMKLPTHGQSFESRAQSFFKVLEHIRLPLISPSYLRHVIKSLDEVKEYQGCQRFISEATERLAVPYCNTARARRTTVIVTVGEEKYRTMKKDTLKLFNPLNKQWKNLGFLPTKVSGYGAVMSGCTLYVAGGLTGSAAKCTGKMWRYDFHLNSWMEMAPMNLPRWGFSLLMADGYLFALGGSGVEGDGVETAMSVDRYDPKANTWEFTNNMLGPYYRPTLVVSLDGLLYFIGRNGNYAYSHRMDEWSKIPPMRNPPNPCYERSAAACGLNGKIYVIGGLDCSIPWSLVKEKKTMECYSPRTNQWTLCAPMQVRRRKPFMAALDGKLYVLGGLDAHNERIPSIEQYCEETDSWETVGEKPPHDDFEFSMCARLRDDHAPTEDDMITTGHPLEVDYYYTSSSEEDSDGEEEEEEEVFFFLEEPESEDDVDEDDDSDSVVKTKAEDEEEGAPKRKAKSKKAKEVKSHGDSDSSSEADIESHYEKPKKKRRRTKTSSLRLEKKKNKKVNICQVCDVMVPFGGEEEHNRGKKHRKNLTNRESHKEPEEGRKKRKIPPPARPSSTKKRRQK